ncbi:hypothetical protein AAHA92_05313 [Salvia divinorum]|uniref:CLAVATA3/ESR (CLE)-related protein 6 n=1 Tax=Salvia divinorum TaxID=28513 RepID=A0ABD1I307_SALDI
MASTRFVSTLLVFFLLLSASAARVPLATANEAYMQLFRRKLGFNRVEFELYKRRSMKVGSDRVAPGGPDPQHHHIAPISP